MMRRREFITLLGGAAAWPVAARAQQPAVPVIGVLFGGSPTSQSSRLSAIRAGLNAVGFIEGQNVAFEYRWAEGQYDRLPGLAAELAGRRVTVIVAIGNTAARVAQEAIASIPVVFETGIDPFHYAF